MKNNLGKLEKNISVFATDADSKFYNPLLTKRHYIPAAEQRLIPARYIRNSGISGRYIRNYIQDL